MSEVVGEAVVVIRTDETQIDGEGSGKGAGKGFNKGFLGSLKGLAVGGAVVAIGAVVGAKFVGALNFDAGQQKLQAQLGLTEEQAAAAGRVAGELYSDNYGDGLGDVQDATRTVISSIKGMRDASEDDLSAATEAALRYSDVFDTEIPDAVGAASQVINAGLAKDAVGAFDLLTAASQRVPEALRQDLFDAATEYSKSFDQIGLSGQQAFSVLAEASDQGVFGLDKAGDAVKEFTIRATDMSTASTDAYKTLGIDAEDAANKILAGGDKAAGATQEVIEKLLGIEDPAKQANTAIALFGTPLEDLGTKNIPQFLESLQGTGDALGEVAGANERAAETLYDTPLVQLQAMWRSLSSTLTLVAVDALGPIVDGLTSVVDVVEQVVPVVEAGLEPALDQVGAVVSGVLLPAFQSAGDYVAANLLPVFLQVVGVLQNNILPTFAAVAAFVAGQLLPAIVGIVVVVAGRLKPIFDQLVETFRNRLLPTVAKVADQIRNDLLPVLLPLIMRIVSIIGWLLKWAATILGKVLPPLIRLVAFIVSKVIPAAVSIITWVVKIINTLISWGAAIGRAIATIARFQASMTGLVKRGLEAVFEAVKSLPGRLLSLGGRFLEVGKSIIGQFVSGLRGAGGLVGDIAGNVWSAVKGLINSAIGQLNRALEFTISLPGPDIRVNPPDIGYLQSGTPSARAGFYTVGEVGPERVYLPEGARVLSAAQTRQAGGSIDYAKLAAALAAALGPLVSGQRPVQFMLPSGDPQAAAMAAINRLATV